MVSPKPTFFLKLLAAPDGDVEAPDWSGGDGRGEEELLPFAAVFEGIEKVDLKADLGGPPTGTGAIDKEMWVKCRNNHEKEMLEKKANHGYGIDPRISGLRLLTERTNLITTLTTRWTNFLLLEWWLLLLHESHPAWVNWKQRT